MKLPVISASQVTRVLTSAGFKASRQSGSHIIMVKFVDGDKITVVVPKHRELAKGTLLSIISQSRMRKEEFIRLLK
jgi:predicted RNA binding protein YcfA (HicA-like mRNA interferase family)